MIGADPASRAIRWPAAFEDWRQRAGLALGQAEVGELGIQGPAGSEAVRERELRLGQLAARRAMAALGAATLEVKRSEFGLELGDLVGSLSHSGGRAVAAVGERRDIRAVGLDLESGVIPLAALHLIANDLERDWVLAAPTARQAAERLRLLFSLKESVYKAWSSLTRSCPAGLGWIRLEPRAGAVLAPQVPGSWLTVAVTLDHRRTALTGAALLSA